MKDCNKSEENRKHSFKIDTPLLKRILLIITYTLVLYCALTRFGMVKTFAVKILSVFSPFIIGFCFAFIINVLLRPTERLWDKLFKKQFFKRIKRPVCLCLSAIIVLGLIFALLFMIIPEFIATLIVFIEALPANFTRTQKWITELTESLAAHGIQIPAIEFNTEEFVKNFSQFVYEYGRSFIDKTAGVTASIFSGIVKVLIAFVLSIYMLSQKESLCRQLKKLLFAILPQKKAHKITEAASIVNITFTRFVTGQLTEAVIIGSMCFIGMLILRIPYASIISVLVGFTSLIPIIGAFVGTAIGAFLILLSTPIKAVWFVIFIIILQQVEGNLIYPRVVGKSVGLPGIWVLAAVTIGGNLFGFVGMLICVPVCSILYAYTKRFTNKQLKIKKIKL